MSMPSLSIATALVVVALVQGNAVRPQWAAAPVRHRRSDRLWRRQDDHDDHGAGGEKCACAGGEADHPFTINCTDTATIRAAATTLGSCTASDAGCKDATPDGNGVLVCNQAFLILQAHHDYCEHDTLLTSEELLVHDYEAVCVNCEVDRGFDDALNQCAEIGHCLCEAAGESTSDAMAALATLDGTCTVNDAAGCCTTADTQAAFRTVVAYHDRCGHDLVEAIEDGLHNYESACETYFCNVATAPFDPNFCAPDPTTASVSVTSAGGGATATNTQVITVSFSIEFSNLDDASKTGIATSSKTELCAVLSRQGITCDVTALGVVVAAGATAGTTTVAVTLPAGTNDDQAAAVADYISATPITITVGGMSATSTGASKISSAADSAALAGAQAFPALVLALVAAMLL